MDEQCANRLVACNEEHEGDAMVDTSSATAGQTHAVDHSVHQIGLIACRTRGTANQRRSGGRCEGMGRDG